MDCTIVDVIYIHRQCYIFKLTGNKLNSFFSDGLFLRDEESFKHTSIRKPVLETNRLSRTTYDLHSDDESKSVVHDTAHTYGTDTSYDRVPITIAKTKNRISFLVCVLYITSANKSRVQYFVCATSFVIC